MAKGKNDYYTILGIGRDASEEELKRAYRNLAIRWHPDRNPGSAAAEERFKSVAEAYAVLSHPERRRQYDVMGEENFKLTFSREKIFQGFEPGDFFKSFGLENARDTLNRITKREREATPAEDAFNESLGNFFAGFGRKTGEAKKSTPDISVSLVLTLAEAAFGADKYVAYNTAEDTVKVAVKVPAGAVNGQRLVLSGKGPANAGARPGNVIVTLIITPDPQFVRQGFDLVTSINLTERELTEGCRPVVRTLSGKSLRLTVPPGTKSGTIFRLPAYGLPKLGGSNGDLLVSIGGPKAV